MEWEIIHEGDTDSGKPTSWVLEVDGPTYGKYIWISGDLDCDEETILEYRVEFYSRAKNDMINLKTCKSLASAKRWVSMHILK